MRIITRNELVYRLDKGEKIVLEKVRQLLKDKSQLGVSCRPNTTQIQQTSSCIKRL